MLNGEVGCYYGAYWEEAVDYGVKCWGIVMSVTLLVSGVGERWRGRWRE